MLSLLYIGPRTDRLFWWTLTSFTSLVHFDGWVSWPVWLTSSAVAAAKYDHVNCENGLFAGRMIRVCMCTGPFFGALEKLQNGTTRFFMSVCPHGTTRFSLYGFSWKFLFDYFRKYVDKIQVSLKSDKNSGYFTRRPIYIFYHISLSSADTGQCFRQKL